VKYGTGPIPAVRLYALLSIAQYNAVLATLNAEAGPIHPSDAAAVAGASAAVLTYLYPGEAAYLEGQVDEQETAPTGSGDRYGDFASGEQAGRSVAAQVITGAQTDGFFAPFTGTVPVCAGCWLPVPTPPIFATLGQARTFVLASADQFRPSPPPAPGSAAFQAALAEVRQISDTRTVVQDSIARLWALPAGTVGPLGYWNEVGTRLIVSHHLNERLAASTLALMNAAGYEAIIASHEAKYFYWLIRPSQADPLITTSIALPSNPSYPSNDAAVSAAAATVLGTTFPSDQAALDAAADEVGISRVYAGIHYRFDSDAGLALGRTIAHYVLDLEGQGRAPLALR
jgi:membrane-associated phospholipid phosphatase